MAKPRERPPVKQLPTTYTPPKSIARPVGGSSGPPGRPEDTWESVASQYNLDVHALIKFNFHTTDTDEVNWYLRRNVGCTTPSPSGWNWTFRGANPGIIYIPIQRLNMDEEIIAGSAGVEGEDGDWDYDPEHFDWLAWSLRGLDAAHIIAEAGGLHLGLVLGEFAGGAFAYIAALELLDATVGQFEEAAIERNKKDQFFWGVSYGLVLGADRRANDFVVRYRFTDHALYIPKYPELKKEFDKAYAVGLIAGLQHGRKMNASQAAKLRKAVRSHMRLSDYPSLYDEDAWHGAAFKQYYLDAATSFRRYLLRK